MSREVTFEILPPSPSPQKVFTLETSHHNYNNLYQHLTHSSSPVFQYLQGISQPLSYQPWSKLKCFCHMAQFQYYFHHHFLLGKTSCSSHSRSTGSDGTFCLECFYHLYCTLLGRGGKGVSTMCMCVCVCVCVCVCKSLLEGLYYVTNPKS